VPATRYRGGTGGCAICASRSRSRFAAEADGCANRSEIGVDTGKTFDLWPGRYRKARGQSVDLRDIGYFCPSPRKVPSLLTDRAIEASGGDARVVDAVCLGVAVAKIIAAMHTSAFAGPLPTSTQGSFASRLRQSSTFGP